MKKKQMTLQWAGTFIELCMGRITPSQKDHIDTHCTDLSQDLQSLWYDNSDLLNRFSKRTTGGPLMIWIMPWGWFFPTGPLLDKRLATIGFEIEGTPATIDPEALQLSFYAPEAIGWIRRRTGSSATAPGGRRC
jgi:hypothetical protein